MSRDYASHCQRKIVSKLWEYCPYCGDALGAASSDTVDTSVSRSISDRPTLRPDGSVRRSPLAKRRVTAQIPAVTEARCMSNGRGENKGKKCYRPKGHSGKHAYYAALFDF